MNTYLNVRSLMGKENEKNQEVKFMKPVEVIKEFSETKIKKDVLDGVAIRGLIADMASHVYEKLSDSSFYGDVLAYLKVKNFVKDLELNTNKKGFNDKDELYQVMDRYCDLIAKVDQNEAYKKDEDISLTRKMASDTWLYLMLMGGYVVMKLRGDISDDEWDERDINEALIAKEARKNQSGSLS